MCDSCLKLGLDTCRNLWCSWEASHDLENGFQMKVIRRAVYENKHVDILQVKKRKLKCIRVSSIQADYLLVIFSRGNNRAVYFRALSAATYCSVTLFAPNIIFSLSFLKNGLARLHLSHSDRRKRNSKWSSRICYRVLHITSMWSDKINYQWQILDKIATELSFN